MRRTTMLAAAILLGIATAMAAGCASNERRSAQEEASAVQSPETLCRQAIAAVSEHCNAEDGNARQCEAAKARSREVCI